MLTYADVWKDILRKMGARFSAQVPPLQASDDGAR
jgi:hypothetical protein